MPAYAFPMRFLLMGMALLMGEVMAAASDFNKPDAGVKTDSVLLQAELPEVNITSVKQQQQLRNEPVSSTVIGAEELAREGAVGVKGLSEMVPNLYIPDYGSRITSSIYVRGLGARMDHPAVGLTVDNVQVLNKDSYDLDIPDMERVEVIRGPQSALYGRNTMGGLINVSTLSPFGFQGWRLGGVVANGGVVKTNVGWYHKFNSRHALSATMLLNRQGGFRRNEYDNSMVEREYSGSARLKYQWRISPSATLQHVAASSLLRQKGYAYESAVSGKINYNDACRYNRFTLTDGLTVTKFHELFTAASISTLQYIDDDLLLDQDFLPQPYFILNQKKRELAFTEDITLRSPGHNSGSYSWLAGVSGFWKEMHMDAPVEFKNQGISELIESHRNDANPYYPISWCGRNFRLNSNFRMPVYGLSAYHESKLAFGEFVLSGALRVEYEKSRLNYHSYCTTAYNIYVNPGVMPLPDRQEIESWPVYHHAVIEIDDTGRLSRDYLMWLPSFSLKWASEASPVNLYLSASRGAKSGGFNTQMFSEVLQQRLMKIMGIGVNRDVNETVGYKPEHSWNFEFGGHADVVSAGLQLDFAMFLIDCRDQQLTMFPDGTTTGRMMTNAGRTRSRGAEISARWNAAENLELNASYGFTDARFRMFSDGINDYEGNRLPYVPSNTIFAQIIYRLPLTGKNGVVAADVNMRFTGPIEWNEANTLRQKMYGVAGASVSWRKNNWELQLWGKNLTDTGYYTFYFKSMGHEFLQRGKPLQIGVNFSVTFS